MNRRLLGAGLLLAAILVLPAVELQAQKKKKDDAPVAAASDSVKLATGEHVGYLKTTPGSDRTFTLEVEQVKLVPNGKGAGKGNNGAQRLAQAQNRLAQAQTQALTARTVQQRQQAAQRIAQAQQQIAQATAALNGAVGVGGAPPGYKYDKSKTPYQFQATEKVKIRTMVIPEEFDSKGEIVKLTAKKKAELRGKDKNLPGYESAIEKLEVGQKIRVTLVAAPKKAAAKDKDADKDAEKDDDKDDKTKQVRLIVILEEAAATTPAGKGKKK